MEDYSITETHDEALENFMFHQDEIDLIDDMHESSSMFSNEDDTVSSMLEMLHNKIKSNSSDGTDLSFLGSNYSDAEISKMKSDVERAEYEVSCRKNDVSNWESKVSLNDNKEHRTNGDYAHAVSRLNEAKSRYNHAVDELNNAKRKLNMAT